MPTKLPAIPLMPPEKPMEFRPFSFTFTLTSTVPSFSFCLMS